MSQLRKILIGGGTKMELGQHDNGINDESERAQIDGQHEFC